MAEHDSTLSTIMPSIRLSTMGPLLPRLSPATLPVGGAG
jgi:hypothetical protein